MHYGRLQHQRRASGGPELSGSAEAIAGIPDTLDNENLPPDEAGLPGCAVDHRMTGRSSRAVAEPYSV